MVDPCLKSHMKTDYVTTSSASSVSPCAVHLCSPPLKFGILDPSMLLPNTAAC